MAEEREDKLTPEEAERITTVAHTARRIAEKYGMTERVARLDKLIADVEAEICQS